MRIFLGPIEVAGFYSAICRGLQEEGVEVVYANLLGDVRKYDDGERALMVRASRAIERISRSATSNRFARAVTARLSSPMRIALFLWAALRCDVFIYAYALSITYHPEWEFRVLRRLQRRLIFSYHGSDSRPPYLGHPGLVGANATDFAKCAELTAEIKTRIRLIRRYADVIIDNPFSAHLQVGPCLNAQAVGNPSPAVPERPAQPRKPGAPVRILHTPSDPAIKGSDVVRAAIATVRARGRDVDYVELTGKPNAEVLEELARCDFVIDQAYSDVPMALFATEAAAHGKAVVVGGYITPAQMAANLAPEWMPPTLYCHPDELVEVVDRLCSDEAFRTEMGAAAQRFVRVERDRRAVAQRILRLAKDDIPDSWWFDPADIEYVNGLGQEKHIRRLIQGTVEYGGVSALGLDDNPSVRARILAFAGITQQEAPEATVPRGVGDEPIVAAASGSRVSHHRDDAKR